VPVANETFGKEASDLLHELGRRIATVSDERRAAGYLQKRISAALPRGNAPCMFRTVADVATDSLNEIFSVE
jgi:hypothetical protein